LDVNVATIQICVVYFRYPSKMSEVDVRYTIDLIFPQIRTKLYERDKNLSLLEWATLSEPGAIHYLENKLDMAFNGTYSDIYAQFPKLNPTKSSHHLSNYDFQQHHQLDHQQIIQLKNAVKFGQPDYEKFLIETVELELTDFVSVGMYGYMFILNDLVKDVSDNEDSLYSIHRTLEQTMIGAVQGRRRDVERYVRNLWSKTGIPFIVLHFYGLIGGLNLGDQETIEYFADKVLFPGFTINTGERTRCGAFGYKIDHLNLGLSTLTGVKLYFSDRFKPLRSYQYKTDNGLIHFMEPWIDQVEHIFSRGTRDMIRWVHQNILLGSQGQKFSELEDLRTLNPERVFKMCNPELVDYYEEVNGSELTRQHINLYFEAGITQSDFGLGSLRYALSKGYSDWVNGRVQAWRFDNFEIARALRTMINK